MRVNPVLFVCALASSSVACLRSTSFHCETSADCGAGGTCQPDLGFCSVSDSDCESQQRYGDSAGGVAGQCVPTVSTSDAPNPIDASVADAPPPVDAPLTGCSSDFVTITGGQTGHVYRLVTMTANWSNQRDACAASSDNAYLAIPDDAGELAAMVDLATSTRFWVGITDQANEGTWLNTKGDAQTFLPWDNGHPDNGQNTNDCVLAVDNGGSAATIRDDKCNTIQFPAICECEPQ